MNKVILKLLSVTTLTAALAAANAYASDPDRYKADGQSPESKKVKVDVPKVSINPDFRVTAKLPVVPSELPIYSVMPQDPAKIDVNRDQLARYFEFTPTKKGEDVASDGTKSLMYTGSDSSSMEYFSSGAQFYMKEQLFDERAPDLLRTTGMDKRSAKKYFSNKAFDFMKENKLQTEQMVFKDVSFVDVSSFSKETKRESNKIVAAAAHFGYNFDGIPAWGPGAKSTLYFGEDGISGYYRAMPEMKKAGIAKTKAPQRVLSEYIEKGKAQSLYRLHVGAVSQVTIDKVELVYFVDAGNKTQESVTPHYLLSGTFIGQDLAAKGASPEIENEFIWMASAID